MKVTRPRAPIAEKIEALVVVAYGLAVWALCAATMGIGMKVATLQVALIVHAVAAPFISALVSFLYFRRRSAWLPLQTAATFLGTVAAMDLHRGSRNSAELRDVREHPRGVVALSAYLSRKLADGAGFPANAP